MRLLRARAPVRFCDLGGWTDIRIVPEGRVLNFAASLYTHVTLRLTGDEGVTIESCDTAEYERTGNIRALEYNSVLDLFKAAIKRSGVQGGIELTVRSDAPPASGLGSSAAMGVATMGALAIHLGKRLLPYEVAVQAQALETEELGLECGVQDQLSAAYGGVNFMQIRYPEASVFPVPLDVATLSELEDRFLLVYTGKSHFSSAMHEKVIAAYEAHEPLTRQAFGTLLACAEAGKAALLSGDLGAFAEAMNANWSAQKDLHPDITTPPVDAMHDAATVAGCVGFKLNGAGGGGTATLLCDRNRNHLVRRVVEAHGMQVLPAKIDFSGLRTWEVLSGSGVEALPR